MYPSVLPCCSDAPASTEIYTLSLHVALPICMFVVAGVAATGDASVIVLRDAASGSEASVRVAGDVTRAGLVAVGQTVDRKSTRLNSSHVESSYAVFCLQQKILQP